MNVDEIPDDDSMMRFNSKDRYSITLFSKKWPPTHYPKNPILGILMDFHSGFFSIPNFLFSFFLYFGDFLFSL